MPTKMGMIDRTLRLVVAAALLYAALVSSSLGEGALFWVVLAVADISAATALIGSCPLYSLVGIEICGGA